MGLWRDDHVDIWDANNGDWMHNKPLDTYLPEKDTGIVNNIWLVRRTGVTWGYDMGRFISLAMGNEDMPELEASTATRVTNYDAWIEAMDNDEYEDETEDDEDDNEGEDDHDEVGDKRGQDDDEGEDVD